MLRLRTIIGPLGLVAAIGCGGGRRETPAPPARLGYIDESAIGTPRDGATLYRRLEGEPATLNPILQTSDYEDFVISDVSRNLVDFDKNLEPVGGLCDRWEISQDKRIYTLHIRNEAVWEDGSSVSSRDAVFTLKRVVDPKVPAVLFNSNFDGLQKVEELDAKTFRATFARPYAFRLNAFNIPVLPAPRYENIDLLSAPENRAPVANGPYRFVKWKTAESIELVRNEKYWGARPHFDRVLFRILPDNAQAYRALESGAVDEMRLSPDEWREAQGDPHFAKCCRTVMFYDLSFLYVGYNNRSPLFSDSATRRAMSMLLDRESVTRHLAAGMARVLSGPWSSEFPGYDRTVSPYPFDPEAARRALSDAGWHAGADGVLARAGKTFDFELLYGAGSSSAEQLGEIFRTELSRVGVTCRPRAMEAATLFKRMDAGDFDAVVAAWSADPNPDPFPYWHSSQAPPNGLNNLTYHDDAADRLIEQARLEFDPARRNEIYRKFHRHIHDDEPAAFLQSAQRYALSKRIGGVVSTPVGLFKFWPDSVSWWDRGNLAPN